MLISTRKVVGNCWLCFLPYQVLHSHNQPPPPPVVDFLKTKNVLLRIHRVDGRGEPKPVRLAKQSYDCCCEAKRTGVFVGLNIRQQNPLSRLHSSTITASIVDL